MKIFFLFIALLPFCLAEEVSQLSLSANPNICENNRQQQQQPSPLVLPESQIHPQLIVQEEIPIREVALGFAQMGFEIEENLLPPDYDYFEQDDEDDEDEDDNLIGCQIQ